MNKFALPALLLAVLVLGGAILLASRGCAPAVPAVPVVECLPKYDKQCEEILALHQQSDWQQAVERWTQLTGNQELCPRQAAVVSFNLEYAQKQLQETASTQTKWERTKEDDRGKPDSEASQGDFIKFYPAGRQLKSTAFFDTTGSGTNKKWVLRGRGHFIYRHQVTAISEVTANNGSRLEVLISFPEVTQLEVVSEHELELIQPESPIIQLVLSQADTFGQQFPQYLIARRIAEIVNTVDPGLHWTLTNGIKLLGNPLKVDDDVEMLARIERLSGHKFKVTYVRDLGIIGIDLIEGDPLPLGDFENLAYNSSLLMDYYLFPSQDKGAGEEWEVDASEVSGMLGIHFDASVSGKLNLAKVADTVTDTSDAMQMRITGGKVHVESEQNGRRITTTLTPGEDCSISYSQDELFVKSARGSWNASLTDFSDNHLLIGTENIRDLKVTSYYEAERIDE
ncbi:hypothetical protein C5Y96_14995 [Blastopirellula marina]|uniref:Uncharacterized protein n=1 Tax=Blastopirellula marina TaxID=124 RepID=A0A2S8FF10_9BACT|nr:MULTISPECIES: hypothetical protein [Pirellulaceae]PQO30763.1 hypothetical protein C5Y96_14995 [Blastopirellula marina]RCS50900.1 hypothetical protein DTL36_15005 [Bremerella cremea]